MASDFVVLSVLHLFQNSFSTNLDTCKSERIEIVHEISRFTFLLEEREPLFWSLALSRNGLVCRRKSLQFWYVTGYAGLLERFHMFLPHGNIQLRR